MRDELTFAAAGSGSTLFSVLCRIASLISLGFFRSHARLMSSALFAACSAAFAVKIEPLTAKDAERAAKVAKT